MSNTPDYRAKITKDKNQIKDVVETLKAEGKKVVFTNGCFDLFHRGHLESLFWAKRQGDILVVALNEDDIIRRLKGNRRPVTRLDDRMALIAGLSCVDYVTCFNETLAIDIISELKPDIVVKGGDYREVALIPEYDSIIAYGGQVKLCPHLEGYASSKILKWLSGNNRRHNNYNRNRYRNFRKPNRNHVSNDNQNSGPQDLAKQLTIGSE